MKSGTPIFALFFLSIAAASVLAALPQRVENPREPRAVLIVLDGIRNQEFFSGADPELGSNPLRREDLFPFLWNELARIPGTEIYGEPEGPPCKTDNPYGISLPAYADIFAGERQDQVKSNEFRGDLQKETLVDRLQMSGLPPANFAVFTSWNNISRVVTRHHPDNVIVDSGFSAGDSVRPPWHDARYDADTNLHIQKHISAAAERTKFLFVAFNDADEWAHKGDYARYLGAANRQDHAAGSLFHRLNALAEFSDNTLFIVTTDHGRGAGRRWTDHGALTPGSESIWAMVHIPPGLEDRGVGSGEHSLMMHSCSHVRISRLIESVLRGAHPVLKLDTAERN